MSDETMTETFTARGGSVFEQCEAIGMVQIQSSLDDRGSILIPVSDLCEFINHLQIRKEIQLLQAELERFVSKSREINEKLQD